MNPTYALILVQNEIRVFQKENGIWRIEPVFREESHSLQSKSAAEIVEKLNEYINSDSRLKHVTFFIIAERPSQIGSLPETFAGLDNENWQLVLWQSAKERAVLVKPSNTGAKDLHRNHEWLGEVLLPTVEGSLNYQDDALLKERERNLARHQAAQKQLEAQSQTLEADRSALEAEISRLKAQAQLFKTPSMEQLSIFLPLLYRNFWNSIKPSDLALLAQTYTIPEVASPFPEPSPHVVSKLKKRLQSLPEREQETLRNFCGELPADLQIRPEMRYFFEA